MGLYHRLTFFLLLLSLISSAVDLDIGDTVSKEPADMKLIEKTDICSSDTCHITLEYCLKKPIDTIDKYTWDYIDMDKLRSENLNSNIYLLEWQNVSKTRYIQQLITCKNETNDTCYEIVPETYYVMEQIEVPFKTFTGCRNVTWRGVGLPLGTHDIIPIIDGIRFDEFANVTVIIPYWVEPNQDKVWFNADGDFFWYYTNGTTDFSNPTNTWFWFRNVSNCELNWTNSSAVKMERTGSQCWIDINDGADSDYGQYTLLMNLSQYAVEDRILFNWTKPAGKAFGIYSSLTSGSFGGGDMNNGFGVNTNDIETLITGTWLRIRNDIDESLTYIYTGQYNKTHNSASLYNNTGTLLNSTGVQVGWDATDEMHNRIVFYDGDSGTAYPKDFYFTYWAKRKMNFDFSEPTENCSGVETGSWDINGITYTSRFNCSFSSNLSNYTFGLDYAYFNNSNLLITNETLASAPTIAWEDPTPTNNTINLTYGMVYNFSSTTAMNSCLMEIDGTNNSGTLSADNLTCSYTLPYAEHLFNNTYDAIGWANVSGTNYSTVNRTFDYYGCGYVNTGWCYQETATTSTSCGGLATGNYVVESAFWRCNDAGTCDDGGASWYDGDWNTFERNIQAVWHYLYVNYTKPANASSSSRWQIKDVNGTILNLTITDACFNAHATNLSLRYGGNADGLQSWAYQCWNGSSWTTMYSGGGEGTTKSYEEAMWWDISNYTMQGNVSISNSTCFTINASNINFDGAGYDISGTYISPTIIYGFYSDHFNDSVIKNLSIHGFYDGIYTINNSNLNITNITSYNNNRYGARLLEGNTNYISYSIFHTNDIGLSLESQQDSTFFNLTIYNNSIDGFDMGEANSQNNLIYNCISHSNNISLASGFTLYQSTNLTFRDNIAYDNSYGAYIYTNNSLFYNNTFYNNSNYQFYINSGYGSGDNTIYNNIFNATNLTQNTTYDESTNYWNTTQTTATNIIGGASIGGNYYSDAGCVDEDFDGICDNPNNITLDGTAGAIDYLPLTYLNRSCIVFDSISNAVQNTTRDTLSVGDTLLYASGNLSVNNTCSENIKNYNFYLASDWFLNDSNANSTWNMYRINLNANANNNFSYFEFVVPLTNATSDGSIGTYAHFVYPETRQYTFIKTYTRDIANLTVLLPYTGYVNTQLYRCNETSCDASDSSVWSESLSFTFDSSYITRFGDTIDDLVYVVSYTTTTGGGGGGTPPPSSINETNETGGAEQPFQEPVIPPIIEEQTPQEFTEDHSTAREIFTDTFGFQPLYSNYTCGMYLTTWFNDIEFCGGIVGYIDIALCELKGVLSLYHPSIGTWINMAMVIIVILVLIAILNIKSATHPKEWIGYWLFVLFILIVFAQGIEFIIFSLLIWVKAIQSGFKSISEFLSGGGTA